MSAIVLATGWLACDGDEATTVDSSECELAIDHYQQLREEQLEADPVLAKFPDVAREHVRQTREVIAAPLVAHCNDRALVRCLNAADSVDHAAACAGGQP